MPPPLSTPSSGPAPFASKAVILSAAACLALSLIVFFCRGTAAFQAAHTAPGIAVTSGYEEESWFALWRAIHDQPVYADTSRQPYASAYFNWLFYATYGAVTGPFAVHRGDATIPAAGRVFTALWALAGGAGLLLLFRRIIGEGCLPAAGLAAMVFAGPLVGWWAHTVRPDVAALALECSALVILLLRPLRHWLANALLPALLFYAAWSFKQTYVMGLASALLFLAVRREWPPTVVLLVTSLVLWAATFLLQGPAYRAAFQSTASTNVYFLSLGLRSLGDMLMKTSPLWLLIAALGLRNKAPAPVLNTQLPRDTLLLGSLGLLVALPLAFVASCKLGAATYYHFTSSAMLAFVASGLLATRRATAWPLTAALLLAAGLQALALVGMAGQVSLADQSLRLSSLWTRWQTEPEPRFSHLTGFNLPWISPSSPPLVLAFNYPLDRERGRFFEHDGVGGLIAAGHFQSLLLPAETGDHYDGGSLRAYQRGITVGDMTLFRRKEKAGR
ncbi:MAG TPA: hypothetical protein VIM71_15140 [Lacunisphaera sp.]